MADPPELTRRQLSDLVRRSYDRTAERYERIFANELVHKPADRTRLEAYAREVAGRGLVADVGCGPGHVSAFLAGFGVRMCGVDLSVEMMRLARRAGAGLPAAAGDMLAMPFQDGALAGVIAFYSIIHLLRADAVHAFREFSRVLRPGGPLLLACHGGEGAVYAEEAFDAPVPLYATLYGAGEMAGYMKDAGLAVEDVFTREPYPAEYPTRRAYIRARRP